MDSGFLSWRIYRSFLRANEIPKPSHLAVLCPESVWGIASGFATKNWEHARLATSIEWNPLGDIE